MAPRPRGVIVHMALLVLLMATVVVPAGPAQAVRRADASCPSGAPTLTKKAARGQTPVILVHGWIGSTGSMASVEKAVRQALGDRVALFSFDYAKYADNWASDPEIGDCLAGYIDAVSNAGGNKKVILVGHSMGGLAIRYASALTVKGQSIGPRIIGVVTLDTPHRGSYWGGSHYARIYAHLASLMSGLSLYLPAPDRDAARCLEHHEGGDSFPKDCGGVAPYLDPSTNLLQVSGQVRVKRTFWGIELYTFSLDGDSIVDTYSQGGYPGSGPSKLANVTGKLRIEDVPCVVTTGELQSFAQANARGLVAQLSRTIGEMVVDNAAMGRILTEERGLSLAPLLWLAYRSAGCGHTNITSNPEALKATTDAITSWLEPAAPAAEGADWLKGVWSGTVDQFNIGSVYPVTIEYRGGRVGTVVGSSTYYTLDCGGDLRLEGIDANEVRLTEVITWNPSNRCVLQDPVILKRQGDQVLYQLFDDGGFTAPLIGNGTLTRTGVNNAVPRRLLGGWEGPVDQFNTNTAYSVHIRLWGGAKGAVVGTAIYTLGCSGELTLERVSGDSIELTEKITEGTGACVEIVPLWMRLESNGTVRYRILDAPGSSTSYHGEGILART